MITIGLKRTIKENKYRSEISNHTKNNNLNYLIDPTFLLVNRLFMLSSVNEKDYSSEKCYTLIIQIKYFNVLIDGKTFFDTLIKNKEQPYEQIVEMSRDNDYATGNLLDYEYFSKHYKLIAIDLCQQIELNSDLKQQINFVGRLDKHNARMFFII